MSASAGPSRLGLSRLDKGAVSPSVDGSMAPDPNVSVEIDFRLPNDLIPFMRRLTDLLDVVTTNADALPPKSDLSFHRTLDRKFAKNQDEAGDRILKLADRLLGTVHSGSAAAKGKARRKLEDDDDVVDGYRRGVLDVVNCLLEDAATNLDDVSGAKKAPVIAVKQSFRDKRKGSFPSSWGVDESTPKPQEGFSSRYHLALRNKQVFWPEMTAKPHALVPFELKEIEPPPSRGTVDENLSETSVEGDSKPWYKRSFEHPYRYETEHLGYPTSMFIHSPPIQPLPLSDPELILVDTPEAYKAMVDRLLHVKEIAVDLEHHSIRSYYGFTCLIQISTREQDWVVDVIKLRELLYEDKLGGIMADPSVIKVFHGADSDVTWLQKDFQIYLVNLFDTHQASRYLEYPQRSLKALVAKFCGVQLDKSLQLADWRARPLTEEMLGYARTDTHYLLYIYDRLRNDLLDLSRQPSPAITDVPTGSDAAPPSPQGAMRTVLAWSEEVALKMYFREWAEYRTGIGPFGWRNAMTTALGKIKGQTEIGEAFIGLHTWRDRTAKMLDEHPQYIMRSTQLTRIAMTAGRPEAQLSKLLSSVPQAYREEVEEEMRGAKSRWERKMMQPKDLGQILPPSTKAPPQTQASATSKARSLEPLDPQQSAIISAEQEEEAEPDIWGTSEEMDLSSYAATFSTLGELFDRRPRPKGRRRRLSPHVDHGPTSDLFGNLLTAETSTQDSADDAATSDLFGNLPISRASKPQSEFAGVKSAIDRALAAGHLPAKDHTSAEAPEASGFTNTGQSGFFGAAIDDAATARNPDEPRIQLEPHGQIRLEDSEGPAKPDDASDDDLSAEAIDDETGEAVVRVKAGGRRRIGSAVKERKAKKAKRSKGPGAKSFVPRSEVEDFDYSSVPSLLEAPPTTTRAERRKRQKGKGGGVATESFGPVAKDPTQPKGGNKSMTFR